MFLQSRVGSALSGGLDAALAATASLIGERHPERRRVRSTALPAARRASDPAETTQECATGHS